MLASGSLLFSLCLSTGDSDSGLDPVLAIISDPRRGTLIQAQLVDGSPPAKGSFESRTGTISNITMGHQ